VSETFRLLIANGDTLLTEAGETLNHDGAATGGGNDPGPEPSGNWELFGASIAGDAAALDADGDTLLVTNTSVSDTDSGIATFLKRSPSGWSGATDFQGVGLQAAISADGNTAVVAYAPSTTAFYILRRQHQSGEWASPQNATHASNFDSTGYDQGGLLLKAAVSRNGQHVVIATRVYAGVGFIARVFDLSSGDWVQKDQIGPTQNLDAREPTHALHISDDGGVVCLFSNDVAGGVTAQLVRSWQWTGIGWAERSSLNFGTYASSGSFSGDGIKVAFGDHLAASGGTERGVAKVYEFANNAWSQVGGDITGTDDYDHLGYSVSLNDGGTVLAVGVRGEDAGGLNSGLVRIYQWNGASWAPVSGDISGTSSNEYLGNSVAISGDGKTVAAGGDVNVLTYELQDNQITITQQPQNVTYSGSPVVFSTTATVSDNSSPSYLWQSSADNGSTWANLSGETSSNLTVSNITPSDDGNQYRAVISAARAPDATTNNATLSVT
jgi:hypothetical protein